MKKYTENVVNRPEISGSDFKGYFVPETVEEALEVLVEKGDDIEILAGGTDLLVDYYQRLYEVPGWLDLRELTSLQKIEKKEDKIEIGAMVTHAQLENSEIIKNKLILIKEAAAEVGSPQIRSRGTIGGNIVTASPAGDLLPPLLAYNAQLELMSAKGREIIPAQDFFTGPKQTVIKDDQLLTKIIIPLPEKNTRGKFVKVGKRRALAISTLSLALLITVDKEQKIREIKAALGAVAPTPLALSELTEKLKGEKLKEIDINEAAEIAVNNISPIDDIRGTKEYREDTVYSLMKQALEELTQEVDR